MVLNAGDRVVVESESTERQPRTGVIEEVLRRQPRPHYRIRWDDLHESGVIDEVPHDEPTPRYRIRWNDGHESVYTPSGGALRRAEGPVP